MCFPENPDAREMLQCLLMSVPSRTGFRDVALIFWMNCAVCGFENVRGQLTRFEVSMLQSDLDRRHLSRSDQIAGGICRCLDLPF